MPLKIDEGVLKEILDQVNEKLAGVDHIGFTLEFPREGWGKSEMRVDLLTRQDDLTVSHDEVCIVELLLTLENADPEELFLLEAEAKNDDTFYQTTLTFDEERSGGGQRVFSAKLLIPGKRSEYTIRLETQYPLPSYIKETREVPMPEHASTE